MFWAICFACGVLLQLFGGLIVKFLIWQWNYPIMRTPIVEVPPLPQPRMVRTGVIKQWFLYGKLHREDGPAVLHPDGSEEWYLNGVRTKAVWATDCAEPLWYEKKEEEDRWREHFEAKGGLYHNRYGYD